MPSGWWGKTRKCVKRIPRVTYHNKVSAHVDEKLTLGWHTYDAETIRGNCDSILFLGGSERTTLEELSKLLGRETIDSYSNSISHGNSPSFGQNFQKLGKELMAIDELAVLDGGKCILQLRGVRPFLSDKFILKSHKNYKLLAEYSDKNKFDIKEYLNTDLKIDQDDVFDAYEITEVIE